MLCHTEGFLIFVSHADCQTIPDFQGETATAVFHAGNPRNSNPVSQPTLCAECCEMFNMYTGNTKAT